MASAQKRGMASPQKPGLGQVTSSAPALPVNPLPPPGEAYPGVLPGTLPLSPPPAPAAPATPAIPGVDQSWLTQTATQVAAQEAIANTPPGQSVPPPSAPTQKELQTIVTQYQAGVTAYQQLTTVHPILRSSIMTPEFPQPSDEDQYFYTYAQDLQTLCTDLLKIPVQQVVDMVTWLTGINSNAAYTPTQMVSLVEKLILGEQVSFPSIELPSRIINFLSHVLRTTVTGAQESLLQGQQDALRQQLYTAIDSLSQAQADMSLAVEEANVPPNVTDPVAWAAQVTAQAPDPTADAILTAQSEINAANNSIQVIQNQIQAVNEDMSSLQTTLLTPDQLAQYLIANLEPSQTLTTLISDYDTIQSTIDLYNSLTQPILTQENQVQTQMASAQAALTQATANFNTAQAAINYAHDTNQEVTPAQEAAYQQAQSALSAAQTLIAPYQAQLSSLDAQMQAIMSAHPEFMVQGDLITDPTVLGNMILAALTTAATSSPADLMDVVQTAMQLEASAADQRTQDIENEQAAMIQAKQNAFQAYYQDQVESQLQFYKDQMSQAQTQFNQLNALLSALSNPVQDLQNEISANINALGQVIGWWAHENNISDDVMSQAYFIGVALNSVMGLNGAYDVVNISSAIPGMSSTQVFWGGSITYSVTPQNLIDANSSTYANLSDSTLAAGMVLSVPPVGPLSTPAQYTIQSGDTLESIAASLGSDTVQVTSSQLAGQTISLMSQLSNATVNYDMQSPALINELNQTNAWMQQLQQAYQVQQAYLNSTAYAQSLLPLFNATPQGELLQSDIDAVVTPLNQISLQVQADQQTMQGILNDLEKQVLSDSGVTVSDLNLLTYDQQKSLWVGVCDHLAGPGQRLTELQGYISAISGRIQAGTPETNDTENLQVAQVALMNIIGAQNIQRNLQNNVAFMAQLQADAAADAQAAISAAQTTAQQAASQSSASATPTATSTTSAATGASTGGSSS